MEQSIVGLLYTQVNDEKVRRWALNVLARLGREATCLQAIIHIIKNYSEEPQTLAAGIAAVFRLSKSPQAALREVTSDKQMMALAALQHARPDQIDMTALPINVDSASPDLLRLALILVGLDRAPANILNPRHDNAQMVKALGGHHDNIVSQYSVWAITENTALGIHNLGVDIKDIECMPPNVRSWIFQLIAMAPNSAIQYLEYIELGAEDPDVEARTGLSLGLKDTYFDGIDSFVLDWFTTEHDQDVNHNLLDHIVKQARHSPNYEAMAIESYEKEPSGSSLRRRMEASAAGEPLYAKLRRIEYDGSNDLFRGGISVTNNFNIHGGIQGGAVALGGNADNTGETSNHYNMQTLELIRSGLSQAERELHSMDVAPDLKREALEQVQAAKLDPSPANVQKAIDALGKTEALIQKATGAGTAIAKAIGMIASAAGF